MRAIRSLWVVLLVGWSAAPGWAWQAGQVTRVEATDLPGNDLGDLVGRARSFDDCAQRCVADGRCGAFTFNLNSGNCIPKSSGGSPQRNARAVSGIVSRLAAPGEDSGGLRGVTRLDATDLPGNDLEDLVGRARSYEDCAQRCIGDGRCGQFTFNLNNGNCIPKAPGSTLNERNDGAVSGVVDRGAAQPPPGDRALPVTRYNATDFPQNDLDDLIGAARSYEDCARRCLADGRCAAFTFNLNNGACIPKSSHGPPVRNDRAVSGVVHREGVDRDRPYPKPGYGGVNRCSVGGTRRCPGCSTSCGPTQRTVCNAPLESPTGFCLRGAECRCSSR